MYKLKRDVSITDVRKKGIEFAQKKDRLGFAKFTKNCADVSYIDNSHYVIIGTNCIIGKYVTLGTPGFGFAKDENGEWHHLYHFGKTIIGDNVWIGAHSNIDRGTVDNTVIGSGTKIDSYVHIGHNCKVGKNCIICAGTILCGKVIIEDDVWLAPGTIVRQELTIGKGSKTGIGAIVVKNINPNVLAYGVPAKEKGENI